MAAVAGADHRGGDRVGVPQLDGPGSDGEEDARADEEPHEAPGVEHVGDGGQDGVDLAHP